MEMDWEHKFHEPVLVEESVEWLAPSLGKGGLLVDCTVGGGGHAEAFLEAFPGIVVVGVDQDPQALEAATMRLRRFGARVQLVRGNFSRLRELLHEAGLLRADAVFYDLGVSSFQLDRPERGFGFRAGAPIDMRMDPDTAQAAGELVNTYSESELTRILARYGQERFARRVARAIVRRRQRRPFQDAGDLADVVKDAIPAATRRTGPHPARRTFQALRIEVNDELGALERSLESAVDVTSTGGRVAAISYHSGEDGIVKGTFRQMSQGCICPRDLPVCRCEKQALLRVLTPKAVRPGPQEIARNPRSDSARLRVAEKLAAPGPSSGPIEKRGS